MGRTDDGLLTANWRILDNTTVHVNDGWLAVVNNDQR